MKFLPQFSTKINKVNDVIDLRIFQIGLIAKLSIFQMDFVYKINKMKSNQIRIVSQIDNVRCETLLSSYRIMKIIMQTVQFTHLRNETHGSMRSVVCFTF